MTSEQDQVFGANPKIGKKFVLLSTKKKTHLQLIYKFQEPPSDLGKRILCIMIVCTEVLISYLCSPEIYTRLNRPPTSSSSVKDRKVLCTPPVENIDGVSDNQATEP